MVGAADRALDVGLLADKDHAPVPADVLIDPHGAGAVAHSQQRLAEELHRHRIARLGDVLPETETRPGAEKGGLLLGLPDRGIGVEGIGQAGGDPVPDPAERPGIEAKCRQPGSGIDFGHLVHAHLPGARVSRLQCAQRGAGSIPKNFDLG